MLRGNRILSSLTDCLYLSVGTLYLRYVSANKGFDSCSVPHLKTVTQLLANMESCQLKSLSKAPSSQEVFIALTSSFFSLVHIESEHGSCSVVRYHLRAT